MKTSILALAAWLIALPPFLKIVEIIVAPERKWFLAHWTAAPGKEGAGIAASFSGFIFAHYGLMQVFAGLLVFALPLSLALIALRRIGQPGSNLKGAAWAKWAVAMAVFGIITILLRWSTGGQVP